ncbi:MAG: DUF3108 domain-containing protein [Myxococcaceae bacterium]
MSHLARLLAAVAILLAQTAQADTTAFGPGEQVLYRASYLGIPAGTVQVTVGEQFAEEPGVWPILALARSDVALFFYPIHDKIIIRWDAEHARTLGVEMWSEENHKRHHLKLSFDRSEPKASLLSQWEGKPTVQKDFAVEPGAVDVGGAIYALRSRALEPGMQFSLPVVTPSKQFVMHVVVESREQLQTPLGPRSTVRVRLGTEFSGNLTQKRDFIIYFTDDETHLPVRLEADLALGSIIGEAVEYHSGLRVPGLPKAAVRTGVH